MNYYFITGTSSGLGNALATRLLQEKKTKVIGIGRKSTIINPNYTHFYIDLVEVAELEQKLDQIFDSLLSPTNITLVNNAGVLGDIKHIGDTSAANILHVMNVNTIAPAILINCFIKKYKRSKSKKTILNISSGAGKNAYDGWANYCTSKAAIDMFSQAIAKEQELNKYGFDVFSIAPGVIDTPMQTQIRAAKEEDFSTVKRFLELKDNKDLSSSTEIAEQLFLFLKGKKGNMEVIQDVRKF